MAMKVSELVEILSKYDGNKTVVSHDGEYADHWQIEDAYETTDGAIKITPDKSDRYDSFDSIEQTQEARDRIRKYQEQVSRPTPKRPFDRKP